MDNQILSVESINAIVASVTHQGAIPLSELEAERLLNAIARAQSGVPTGTRVQGLETQNTRSNI